MSQGWQYLAYSDVITTVLLAAMCYAFASLIALYYFLCQRDYVFALVTKGLCFCLGFSVSGITY